MKEKFLIYLMDEKIVLYKGASEKLCTFTGTFEEVRSTLEDYIDPQDTLYLLIDRNHQDIQEEKMPPLYFWDRMFFLFHKKTSCSARGGYAGFQFLKEGKDFYFRWIHISEDDPIVSWISWITSRSGAVFFVALEGRGLLKSHFVPTKGYQMLLYPLPEQKMRHVLFKGNRFLFSRLSQEVDDIKASLHFLSRKHSDIYENLEVLSLGQNLFLPHVKMIPDTTALIHFISTQKKPSLCIRPLLFSKALWMRRGIGVIMIIPIVWMGFETYKTFEFKRRTIGILPEVASLKSEIQVVSAQLQSKDTSGLRRALEHYNFLKSYTHDPLQDFDEIAALLKNSPVRLENLRWQQDRKREITLTLLMLSQARKSLTGQFESFLSLCQTYFPRSQIHIIEAPFNSSPHEVFKSTSEGTLPLASIKIVFP